MTSAPGYPTQHSVWGPPPFLGRGYPEGPRLHEVMPSLHLTLGALLLGLVLMDR